MKGKQINWSVNDDNYLLENYGTLTANQIGINIGRTRASVKNRCTKLKLKLDPETRAKQCDIGKFRSGQDSWNKGKKQSDYMSKEAIKRTKATRFKKGNLPHNTKADGVITVRKDNRGIPYQFIRIGSGEWIHLHWQVWFDKNGQIPEGGIVRFKDGNTMNCVIENLELIDMAENMKRNTIHRYPEDLKELIRLQAKLNRKISKIETNG